MAHFAPPIVKAAERILLDVELAVQRWTRYHKYASGKSLRETALRLAVLANLAWREPARRTEHVRALVAGVERLKVELQLGSQLRAFTSFGQFDQLARQAHELGRQAGGWAKELHLEAQNPGRHGRRERGQELSTRAARSRANA